MPARAALLLLAAAASVSAQSNTDFFERKIRPLLAAKCYGCHSGKVASGGLRLDLRDAIRKGGGRGPAVVPSRPDASLILHAVSYKDEALRMPPTGKLSDGQILDLTRWIEMGAPDPRDQTAPRTTAESTHWAFRPFRAHPQPATAGRAWAKTWIDHYVLAKLEAAGLKPALPAGKRTWIRRVTFDLTGIPPTPAEIDAFLADTSAFAHEKVADRLLASPHYGERWARHWLDLARYAETDGHEFDREKPNAWRYRDYVIRALNDDLPYDQFVREHIAGDMVPARRMASNGAYWDSPVATGFFGLHEERNAADDLGEVRAEKLDNQIDTLSKTFLGLTVACARCHDHKFDPITRHDYYALAGILDSKQLIQASLDTPSRMREWTRARATLEEINGKLQPLLNARRQANPAATVPGELPTPDHVLYPLAELSKPSEKPFAERLAAVRATLQEWTEKGKAARGDEVIADFSKGSYDGWRVEGPAFGDAPSHQIPPQQTLHGHRGEAIANSMNAGANEFTGFLYSRSFRNEKRYMHVRLAGSSDATSGRQPGLLRVSLVGDGRDAIITADGSGRFTWKTAGLGKMTGETAFIEIADRSRTGHIAVDQIILSDSRQPPALAPSARVIRMLEDESIDSPAALTAAYRKLFEQAIRETNPTADARAVMQAILPAEAKDDWELLRKQHAAAAAAIADPSFGMISVEDHPHNVRIAIAGNHRNLGEEVPRRFLSVISDEAPEAFYLGSGRAKLSESIASGSNPLTARVLVNRIWKHHFGQGLVRSLDNFGRMGERPTHAELLDTLAARFVDSGWRIKALHKTIVLSATYRQSSKADAKSVATDGNNRLLHHMPVRRLEAEAVRDTILAVTGSLDRAVYGPSVAPHISDYQDGRGKPAVSGPVDGMGRRSIYLGVRRNFLPPMFMAFDYPMTVTTVGRRGTSTVPSQALILMNSEFVTSQAARWADRVLALWSDPKIRIANMYLDAYGRAAEPAEVARATDFLASQASRYKGAGDADFRAWADLAHAMINSKEFLFIP